MRRQLNMHSQQSTLHRHHCFLHAPLTLHRPLPLLPASPPAPGASSGAAPARRPAPAAVAPQPPGPGWLPPGPSPPSCAGSPPCGAPAPARTPSAQPWPLGAGWLEGRRRGAAAAAAAAAVGDLGSLQMASWVQWVYLGARAASSCRREGSCPQLAPAAGARSWATRGPCREATRATTEGRTDQGSRACLQPKALEGRCMRESAAALQSGHRAVQ